MTIILVLVAIAVIALLLWGVTTYNRLIRLRTAVQGSWKQVDVELQRRFDLIPNLIGTVKGAAGFEKSVLQEVTEARTAALQAKDLPPTERQVPEQGLSSALKHLFAVAEAYPALTATANYRDLQEELSNTEDRIAAARTFYNQNVEEFNATQLVVPTRFIAGPLGFKEADYFEVTDPDARGPVAVAFSPDGL